jgi:hypothetical protein
MEIKWGLFQDADVPESCALEPCPRLESPPLPPLGAAPASFSTLRSSYGPMGNPELPPAGSSTHQVFDGGS